MENTSKSLTLDLRKVCLLLPKATRLNKTIAVRGVRQQGTRSHTFCAFTQRPWKMHAAYDPFAGISIGIFVARDLRCHQRSNRSTRHWHSKVKRAWDFTALINH